MATGNVVKVWRAGGRTFIAVRVAEADGPVEYIGHVADDELQGLTLGQQKAKLGAAAKTERDRRLGAAGDVAGIGGTVSL